MRACLCGTGRLAGSVRWSPRHVLTTIAALLVWATCGAAAHADEALSPALAPGPSPVLQASTPGGIEVAAWAPDERMVVTASAVGRTVMVLAMPAGTVVDRLTIPAAVLPAGLPLVSFTAAAFSADGGRVTLRAACQSLPRPAAEAPPPRPCAIVFTPADRTFVAAVVPDDRLDLPRYGPRLADLLAYDRAGSAGAAARLPRLPASPGGTRLLREPGGLAVVGAAGRRSLFLADAPAFSAAGLAPDGRTLALIAPAAGGLSVVRQFDLATGRFRPAWTVPGTFARVRWIDQEHLLLLPGAPTPDEALAMTATTADAPALLIDLAAGRIAQTIPGRCLIVPIAGGAYYGAGTGDCRGDAAPLATATVGPPGALRAALALDQPLPPDTTRLVAVETEHNWGAERIAVELAATLPAPQKARLEALLAPLPFVRRSGPYQAVLAPSATEPGAIALTAADGALLQTLGQPGETGFTTRLGEALRLMLSSRLLLGLATPGPAGAALCLQRDADPVDRCDPAADPPLPPIPPGIRSGPETYHVSLRNGARARHLYVLAVSPDLLTVNQVLPPPGTENGAIAANQIVQSESFYFPGAGSWRFVVLAAPGPINTAALEQRGLAARDPAACAGGVDRVLCAAADGRQDPAARAAAGWSATVSEVVVKPGKPMP